MITENLSKAIHKGWAYYDTFVFGPGGAGIIPVKDKSICVITDIVYFPFADEKKETELPNDLENFARNSIHQLSIYSRSSRNNFVVRTNPKEMGEFSGKKIYSPGDPVKFDTYLIHTSDVHININHLRAPIDWAVFMLPVTPENQEESGLLGYGGKTALKEANYTEAGVNIQYKPFNKLETSIGSLQGYVPGLGVPATADNVLNNPKDGKLQSIWGFPIINFGMVVINHIENFNTISNK